MKKQVQVPVINSKVDKLQVISQQIKEFRAEEDRTIGEIRAGFVDCVVVFIDLVDSTRFKMQYHDKPEQWIARLMQFTRYLSDLVASSNGRVVKFIGDEVMAVFDQDTKVNDALNLVTRLEEIQSFLTGITGFETQVKITIDKGNVYMVEYEGHNESDPQGTPIDRCARIAKYAEPGTIVTSFEYQKYIGNRVITHEVGTTDLKGLGKTTIYQLFEHTIQLEEKIEIPQAEYALLLKERDTFEAQNSELKLMNKNLQTELNQVGVAASPENTALDAENEEGPGYDEQWQATVRPLISKIKEGIRKAGVPSREYARFLFLFFRNGEGQQYNVYEGHTFDQSIEHNLVVNPEDNGYYILNAEHKLNYRLLGYLEQLEPHLREWEADHPEDEDFSDYDCSLKDPKFWHEFLDIYVG